MGKDIGKGVEFVRVAPDSKSLRGAASPFYQGLRGRKMKAKIARLMKRFLHWQFVFWFGKGIRDERHNPWR